MSGITISRMEPGRIVEDWSALDSLERLRLFGLVRTLLAAPAACDTRLVANSGKCGARRPVETKAPGDGFGASCSGRRRVRGRCRGGRRSRRP
jgi:hypothetical protein